MLFLSKIFSTHPKLFFLHHPNNTTFPFPISCTSTLLYISKIPPICLLHFFSTITVFPKLRYSSKTSTLNNIFKTYELLNSPANTLLTFSQQSSSASIFLKQSNTSLKVLFHLQSFSIFQHISNNPSKHQHFSIIFHLIIRSQA